ncbi:hypothetical protein FOMPIDRAFT_1020163 [Fomitopsis schrenkii]|uniref:Uncharacterized protein n=1 Tax=Fomitopsis schrenkii TaxID=2126942 RepID=S8DL66_FOMSC|nr:hypothetical protein FOMPIDRAFT_1020163 [Fomitopsis schrenkii]
MRNAKPTTARAQHLRKNPRSQDKGSRPKNGEAPGNQTGTAHAGASDTTNSGRGTKKKQQTTRATTSAQPDGQHQSHAQQHRNNTLWQRDAQNIPMLPHAPRRERSTIKQNTIDPEANSGENPTNNIGYNISTTRKKSHHPTEAKKHRHTRRKDGHIKQPCTNQGTTQSRKARKTDHQNSTKAHSRLQKGHPRIDESNQPTQQSRHIPKAGQPYVPGAPQKDARNRSRENTNHGKEYPRRPRRTKTEPTITTPITQITQRKPPEAGKKHQALENNGTATSAAPKQNDKKNPRIRKTQPPNAKAT